MPIDVDAHLKRALDFCIENNLPVDRATELLDTIEALTSLGGTPTIAVYKRAMMKTDAPDT